MGLSLSLTYLNYRGLHVVGNAVVTGTLFILVPFVVLTLACVPHAKPSNWTQVRAGAPPRSAALCLPCRRRRHCRRRCSYS